MTILQKVSEIIVETTNCNSEDVKPEASLEELGVDSLKAITVVFELEEAFDIDIPNEVLTSIITVNDILEKIEEIRAQ